MIKIPVDAIIPEEKLTRYLLIPRARDDKSKFIAQAGFTQENPEALLAELRLLADSAEAVEDRKNEYGTFYRVEGEIEETSCKSLFHQIFGQARRLPHKKKWLLWDGHLARPAYFGKRSKVSMGVI